MNFLPTQWPRTFTSIGIGAAALVSIWYISALSSAVEVISAGHASFKIVQQDMADIQDRTNRLQDRTNQLNEMASVDRSRAEALTNELKILIRDTDEFKTEFERQQAAYADALSLWDNPFVFLFEPFATMGRVQSAVFSAGFLFISFTVGELAMLLGRIFILSRANRERLAKRTGRIARWNNPVLTRHCELYDLHVELMFGIGFLLVVVTSTVTIQLVIWPSVTGVVLILWPVLTWYVLANWFVGFAATELDAVVDAFANDQA